MIEPPMKNKTLAAWLAFAGGPVGLHRFYLHGLADMPGWLLPIPTALGLYGIERVQQFGLDDPYSWVLIPLLGFTVAGCALRAILYALMSPQAWNARFNPQAAPDAAPGRTGWGPIGASVVSLLVGASVLMASIAFSVQRYFEYQIEEARKISQSKSPGAGPGQRMNGSPMPIDSLIDGTMGNETKRHRFSRFIQIRSVHADHRHHPGRQRRHRPGDRGQGLSRRSGRTAWLLRGRRCGELAARRAGARAPRHAGGSGGADQRAGPGAEDAAPLRAGVAVARQ